MKRPPVRAEPPPSWDRSETERALPEGQTGSADGDGPVRAVAPWRTGIYAERDIEFALCLSNGVVMAEENTTAPDAM